MVVVSWLVLVYGSVHLRPAVGNTTPHSNRFPRHHLQLPVSLFEHFNCGHRHAENLANFGGLVDGTLGYPCQPAACHPSFICFGRCHPLVLHLRGRVEYR